MGYLLLLCVLSGCGGEAEGPLVTQDPSGTEGGVVQENNATQLQTLPSEGRLRMKSDEAPVLIEMNEVFYRVYEIDEKPYSGKIMEYHDNGIEKKEIVYTDGALARRTEWHENGNKKMEAKIEADGRRQETYWDEAGNEQRKPVAAAAALGRKMNWTLSVNARSIDVAYRGKSSEIIRKGFGEPDDNQNGVWVYRGMKVQTAQGLMTTVRFVMRNDLVFQISVEP
jgi:hypothetical protein